MTGIQFTPTRFSEGYSIDEVDDYLDSTLLPRLRKQRSGQDIAADSAGPEVSADRGGVLHPAEQRPGLLKRLFGGGR